MIGFLLILFPFLLLGFVLLMERVEQPLSHIAPERELQRFLKHASPAEVASYVQEETAPVPRRRRGRFGLGRLRRSRRSPR